MLELENIQYQQLVAGWSIEKRINWKLNSNTQLLCSGKQIVNKKIKPQEKLVKWNC